MKLLSPLYWTSSKTFLYSSRSSGSVISPSFYAFASSATNLYCAIFASGFGGGPVVLWTGAALAFAGAAAAELDDAAAAELDDAAAAELDIAAGFAVVFVWRWFYLL